MANRLMLVVAGLLSGCASYSPGLPARTSDVACIRRLFDYPTRELPFSAAAATCVGHRPADLTGARYYQTLASTYNVPFVSHDAHGSDTITLTGSRIPVSTTEPAPPELQLR